MINQEVIMHNPLPTTGLIAHDKAFEAASMAISLVPRVPAPLKSLANQVIRSASSVPANLSEGHGRSGRDRMHPLAHRLRFSERGRHPPASRRRRRRSRFIAGRFSNPPLR